jgi:hypothetical protein
MAGRDFSELIAGSPIVPSALCEGRKSTRSFLGGEPSLAGVVLPGVQWFPKIGLFDYDAHARCFETYRKT